MVDCDKNFRCARRTGRHPWTALRLDEHFYDQQKPHRGEPVLIEWELYWLRLFLNGSHHAYDRLKEGLLS